MNTTIVDTFDVLLTATDNYNSVETKVQIIVYDNQTDDDNDGIANYIDKINGTVEGFDILIDGDAQNNETLDAEFPVSLIKNNETVVTFEFDFNSKILSLTNTEIKSDETSNGNIIVTGLDVESKTVYIDALNSSTNGVCIQDVENPTTITSYCTGAHETFVPCNGTITNGYTCSAINNQYMITGLHHSAVTQKCIDTDEDTYGLGCNAGNDCDDTNAAISPAASEIYDNGIDDNCDGNSATTPAIVTTTIKPATGGGGAGPNILETEVTTEITAQEESALELEQTIEENNIPDAKKITEAGFFTEPLVTSMGLSQITGAAITDLASGKVTASVFGLIAMIMICCSLLFGTGYYAIKHKRIHEQIDFFSPQEALKTIYEGVKEFFKR